MKKNGQERNHISGPAFRISCRTFAIIAAVVSISTVLLILFLWDYNTIITKILKELFLKKLNNEGHD